MGIDSTYKTNKYRFPLVEIVRMTLCNYNFLAAYALIEDESEISYSWVLSQLRTLIGNDVHSNMIVTDRELGLIKPIQRHFPYTGHLLCTWHINKDVENRVYHISGKSKQTASRCTHGHWKRLMESETEVAFDTNWKKLRLYWDRVNQGIADYLERTWLPYKEKFICAWTNQYTHFGNTTCRVESAQNALKKWL